VSQSVPSETDAGRETLYRQRYKEHHKERNDGAKSEGLVNNKRISLLSTWKTSPTNQNLIKRRHYSISSMIFFEGLSIRHGLILAHRESREISVSLNR